MPVRTRFVFLSVLALLATSAWADIQQSIRGIDFEKIIPPPPADNSPAGMADLETVLNVQKWRTEEQVQEAQRVDRQSPCGFARPVMGEWFHSDTLPQTRQIMDELTGIANAICNAAKKHWNRQRPYQRDPEVHPATGRPGNASYPSGHSFGATIWAIMFSAAFPEYKAQFDEQAHRAMWGRVMAGVHYPTDTTAGYILAQAVGAQMLKSAEVQQKIREIRREVLAKRPASGAETREPALTPATP